MPKFWEKVKNKVKDQDLFGVPVTLTYNGSSSFNTVCGGCASLILIVSLVAVFVVQLCDTYHQPQFQSYPSTFNYVNSASFQPKYGNTIALWPYADSSQVRVRFNLYDRFSALIRKIDAVYCSDFFAEQLQAEKNGTWTTDYFTGIYIGPEGYRTWVCPDVHEVSVAHHDYLVATLEVCSDDEPADVYAAGVRCGVDPEQRVGVNVMLTSTNFVTTDYYKEQTLQLWAAHKEWFDLKTAQPVQSMTSVRENENNTLSGDFIWPSRQSSVITTTIAWDEESNQIPQTTNVYQSITVSQSLVFRERSTNWFRTQYLTQFTNQFTAFALSIVSFVAFVMSFFTGHEQSRALLGALYGQAPPSERLTESEVEQRLNESSAQKVFEERVRERSQLDNNYGSQLAFTALMTLCCCFKKQCFKSKWVKRRARQHQKFQLALERLTQEQDLQHLIQMNRISRMLHKMTLLPRQQVAINFSQKYVVSDYDVFKEAIEDEEEPQAEAARVDSILEGFDPVTSQNDRRILYEVTGLRLYQNEFRDENYSESDGDSSQVILTHHAQVAEQTISLSRGAQSNQDWRSLNT